MKRTPIQQYATAIANGLIEQAEALSGLEHQLTKGRLRELFIANVLDRYLTSQFGVGSGIVVNQRGDQSRETDIIVFDNRVLPPFIVQGRLGLFPVEAVVATIEVKSRVTPTEIIAAEEAAETLCSHIACTSGSIYCEPDITALPNCSFFGLAGGVKDLEDEKKGRKWLSKHKIGRLGSICVVNEFAWVRLADREWHYQRPNKVREEMKTYIGVLVDNIRTLGEKNYSALSKGHRDWVSVYTRDNPAVRRTFESENSARGALLASGQ